MATAHERGKEAGKFAVKSGRKPAKTSKIFDSQSDLQPYKSTT
jgi:hypothetical protein